MKKKKVWRYKNPADCNEVKHLSAALSIDMSLAALLVQRGIKTYNESRSFFRPKLSDLHDPFLMKGMDRAVERFHRAISGDEKILVYGDYDVDGTTSVALICQFLKNKITSFEPYIPDRYSEGYGVSIQGIEYAAENNFSLIIVLDCGIKALNAVQRANDLGVDVIICDHHNPGDVIPDAYAVLDPKQVDCPYPYKELSGCGVGFKLIQAYCIAHNIMLDEIYELLDLVVVSIASDIVPITGENRVLAYYGLKKLNSAPSIGLKAIMRSAGIISEIRLNDIVFKIGPRLNAAGRIEHGKKSVLIMIADTEEEARVIGKEIDSFNEIRKTLDRDTTAEALKQVEVENLINADNKSTVVYNRFWHKGVVGIVASRLTEKFYRPTVVLTESNGLATGSARSVGSFDLYEAVEKCSDLLESYGGHMYAIGLTMKIENIGKFKRRFEELVSEAILDEDLVETIDVDAKISLSDITTKFRRILRQFEPHGPYNTLPIFVTENVLDYGGSAKVGRNGEHLKLDLIEANRSSSVYSAIAFSQAGKYDVVKQTLPFDICYAVTDNEYRGKTSLQLQIKSIRSSYTD